MPRGVQDRRGASAIECAGTACVISVAAMAAMLSLGAESQTNSGS